MLLGASTDTREEQAAFKAKFDVPFRLLADHDKALATAYGVLAGAGYANRVTFLIDEAGKIEKVYPKVSPKEHAAELLRDVTG